MLFIYIKFVYVLFLLQVTNISATTSYIGYEWLRGDSGTCDAECAAINADCDVTGMNTITTSQSVLDLAAAIGTSWLCAGGTETGVYAPSYVTSTGKCEYLASGETSACNLGGAGRYKFCSCIMRPTVVPTSQPSGQPTSQPTTSTPTNQPSTNPSSQPTNPTGQPTSQPTSQPTMDLSFKKHIRDEVTEFSKSIFQLLGGFQQKLRSSITNLRNVVKPENEL